MSEKLTTAGAILLKHSMPTEKVKNDFDIYTPLDKKAMGKLVTSILKDGGKDAGEHINGLAKLFFNRATDIGASTPLSDYINNSTDKQTIIDEYDMKVRNILMSDRHKSIKNKEFPS